MDNIEKNIKGAEKVIKFSKYIDFRQVADTLQVKVYATGKLVRRSFKKTLAFTMDYDVSMPVQLYLAYKGKHLVEGFN